MLRALRIENRPNDTRVAVVPRIPARERIVQVAAGNDYLAAAVGFKHDTPADGILLPVALIVGAIVHDRRQIDAEDSRIVPANSPSIRTARHIVPVTAVPQIVVVSEHESPGSDRPQVRIECFGLIRRLRVDDFQPGRFVRIGIGIGLRFIVIGIIIAPARSRGGRGRNFDVSAAARDGNNTAQGNAAECLCKQQE